MANDTYTCRKHDLKFEYPSDWDEEGKGLRPPACPLCKDEELQKFKGMHKTVKAERDLLLSAIELKINVESEKSL